MARRAAWGARVTTRGNGSWMASACASVVSSSPLHPRRRCLSPRHSSVSETPTPPSSPLCSRRSRLTSQMQLLRRAPTPSEEAAARLGGALAALAASFPRYLALEALHPPGEDDVSLIRRATCPGPAWGGGASAVLIPRGVVIAIASMDGVGG